MKEKPAPKAKAKVEEVVVDEAATPQVAETKPAAKKKAPAKSGKKEKKAEEPEA